MLDIKNARIRDIQAAYLRGEATVREVVLAYLARIAQVDQCDSGYNSILEVNPDILFVADRKDAELRAGRSRGTLFGIPVLLKDNINTSDKLVTSAGSVALEGNFAPYDAFITAKIRDAGAIILGKANMTEFANYMSGTMPNGYSSRGGQVYSPFNRDADPSGSSTGSAVAVAAGLCPVSVGTETCGSIISPAWENGIVGIKPTMGLVSRRGIIPISKPLTPRGRWRVVYTTRRFYSA